MKNYFLLIFFSSFFIFSLNAQHLNSGLLDSLLEFIDENDQGMGSISLYKSGKEIYQKSMGYASIEEGNSLDSQTLLAIGSISKTYTAAIVFSLIEEGKLSLEQKLSDFYPEIKNSNIITIEHLLYHRSGLFNFTAANDYLSWNMNPHAKNELIHKFVVAEPVFHPGEKAEYSNTNFVLLTLIAEKVTSKSYAELLNERILVPCKCKNTDVGGDGDKRGAEHIASSYGKEGRWNLSTVTHPSLPLGAGAIYATPSDVNRFMTCLFEHKIVNEASLNSMKNLKDGYGAGLFDIPFYDNHAFGHTGGIDGFSSMTGFFPKDSLAITYISNAVSYPINDIMIGALSAYYNKPFDFPEFKQAVSIKSKALDKYVGTYSSETFPLKVTITKEKDSLYGQATGQPSFPLTYVGDHSFTFASAQLTLTFEPTHDKMTLIQGGGTFVLNKE